MTMRHENERAFDSPRPPCEVTLYARPGCHLCEDAEELLEDLSAVYALHTTVVDITQDVVLYERYKFEIPVVVVTGGGTVAGRIDGAMLRRAVEESGATPRGL